jgi:putative phosphoribosyl transferase
MTTPQPTPPPAPAWQPIYAQLVTMAVDDVHIEGMLQLPPKPQGLVLFAHGSGSSRHSPRNNAVARVLHQAGLGTFLLDLLTVAEDLDYLTRFDIDLLTHRLLAATRWVRLNPDTQALRLGYFGASTGAAAALQAAAALGTHLGAVVSRGGRPDLAGEHDLARVTAPTLLLVGSLDGEVLELNRAAYARLPGTKALVVVPGASHLFEEPGTLAVVSNQASAWFTQHLMA